MEKPRFSFSSASQEEESIIKPDSSRRSQSPSKRESSPSRKRGPPPSDWDDDDDERDDYREDYNRDQRKDMKKKQSKKCAGRKYTLLPLMVYLIVVVLSLFGLLLSKQSMAGNLGLIVLELIITVIIGLIVYYLSVRCKTITALVFIIIALAIQLFMIAAAGIWFII